MKEIYGVDGDLIEYDDIIKSIEEDNIILNDVKDLKTFDKYYNSELKAKILAGRYKDMEEFNRYINTKLTDIVSKEFIEKELPDVKHSTPTINKCIDNNKDILIVSDYDVDGVTSAVIAYKILRKLFNYKKVHILINDRLNGNGFNKVLESKTINFVKEYNIGLVITTDHGSVNKEAFDNIKEAVDVDIIVTDHHLFKDDTAPYNVEAFINPQRYEDTSLKAMTGTGVIYFTLLHALYESKIKEYDINYVYYLLTYVGLTLISDCMDLRNYINRKILIKTLTDINNDNLKHDLFWKHIKSLHNTIYVIDETVLGFSVIPMLNSPGRISDAVMAFNYMTTEDESELLYFYNMLLETNDRRKLLQNKAITEGKKVEYSNDVIKVVTIDKSEGVQGIIANNIMYNENYKIAICFTNRYVTNKGKVLIGSGRSQGEELSLKKLIDNIAKKDDIVIKHGGHSKAIGLMIKDDLKKFYELLRDEVKKYDVKKIEKYYVEEYIYSMKKLLLSIYDVIEVGPYGIGFPKPYFVSDFYLHSFRIFKRNGYMLSFKVKFNKNSTSVLNAFYSIKNDELKEFEEKLKTHKHIRMVYSVNVSTFRNYNNIALEPIKIIFK